MIFFFHAGVECDINFEHSCYVLVADSLSAAGARSKCQLYGGHLAIIGSQQENDAIYQGLLGEREV